MFRIRIEPQRLSAISAGLNVRRVPSFSRSYSFSSASPSPSPSPSRSPSSSPSTSSTSRRVFDPKKILPSAYGEVRICSNTVRDAQQSNLSAEMADVHRQQIGRMINAVYADMKTPYKGYEQIWGGTVPMFDVWKRGVQPFDELREMTSHMPDTPASCLVRSNALNAMSNQPADVVDHFIRLSVDAGMQVFTNFCAHNDPRNHIPVAEAVLKYRGHYQAAISWAVDREDPTIYNVQWAVDFFREMVAMGAHSLYVKDPSGVLTPEMAGVLAAEIKSAFPDLPLVFHTHYQTGYAYMTYLEAVKNGANGIECSIGFPDGAGQPYSLTMLRTLEDYGFNTGSPNKAAMQAIADECAKIRRLYPQAMVVRTPDIRVEETGIAGGQRSILDKELQDVGQSHLIPLVDKEVQHVRAQGGKVCQVTPVADSYAREAMRRLRGGSPTSNFAPGYASILTGESGLVKEPVDPTLQKQALIERANAKIQAMLDSKQINAQSMNNFKQCGAVQTIVEQMLKLSIPVVSAARLKEVESRIHQLQKINSKPAIRDSLNRRILNAAATDPSTNQAIRNIDDRLRILERERDSLKKILTQKTKLDQQTYESLCLGRASDSIYQSLLSKPESAAIRKLVDSQQLPMSCYRSIVAVSGVYTAAPILLLPNAMETARETIRKLDDEHLLGLADDQHTWDESAVIQSSYAKAAIPGLVTDFLMNYKENPKFWKPTYTVENGNGNGNGKKVSAPSSSLMRIGLHGLVESHIGSSLLSTLRETHTQHQQQLTRLDRIKTDSILSSRFPQRTIERIQERIMNLQTKQQQLMEQAIQALQKAIRNEPNQYTTVYPNKPTPHVDVDAEVKIAQNYLQQLVET